MSFRFGFGWAKTDPDDLCMKEDVHPSELSHVRCISNNPGLYVLQFKVCMSSTSDFETMSTWSVDGDFEPISTQMVSS